MEDWGDTRAYDGTVSIIQPLIAPLHDSHSHLKVLDVDSAMARKIVIRDRSQLTGQAKAAQRTSSNGGVSRSMTGWSRTQHCPRITTGIRSSWPVERRARSIRASLELVFRPDVYLYDGRYANNVWLQELPHPMTKLTWDNAVFVSTEDRKSARPGQPEHRWKCRFRGNAVKGSVWILPGHPDESLTVDLGWGRTQAGRAGNGAGFDAYLLRASDALWHGPASNLRKLDEAYPLATTQMHQAMEDRDIVIHGTLDEYKKHPDFAKRKEHEPPET